ncbi:chloride channel protein [Maioricimonas sp. JC845]|uniref:chloride channel protein n=1 Tax=Maioricimonas sp. JC845 TaxID=3232138 RepID=UPI0034583715
MITLNAILKALDWKSSGKWIVLSTLVGIISGIGAIVFQLLGHLIVHATLVQFAGYAPREAIGEHGLFEHHDLQFVPWMIAVVMAIGGLASGFLVYTFAPEAEGHGTDAAIDAYHNKRGVIRSRIPIVKTFASAITLGTGGSGGREGPIAQIGAGFGSYLATALKLPARDRRILLAAGMGAGVGAIFRAPLAGALFAAEILYSDSDLEADVIIPAATSSIIGYTVYTLSLPESIRYMPLFGPNLNYVTASPLELFPYAALALVVSLVAVIYIKVFYGLHDVFARLPIPRVTRPALGAALAGIAGVALYRALGNDLRILAVLSTGYGTLQDALTSATDIGIPLLLTIAFVKILTTSLTISSGGSGGVFGPSMVIGGCVGSAVGLLMHGIWPELVPNPEAFGIVGMAGFFAGSAHAPFSTIIMVSEMTGGYELLLPTMWVSTLCFIICRRWRLYRKQVPSRLESPAHRGDFMIDVLEGIRVDDVFDRDRKITSVHESMALEDIVHVLAETQQHYFPVVDTEQRMVGIFSSDDVRAYLYDETIWQLAVARDVMNSNVVSVTPEDDLNTAMRCFTAIAIDELPVVDSSDRHKLLGTLRHKETIAAYNRRMMEFKVASEED